VRSFRDRTEIAVQVGEVFEIVLGGNFTTGYRWELTQQPDAISMMSDEMRAHGEAPGSAGTQHFQLAAESGGRFLLEFSYRRPWEDASADERRIEVQVE
jgi:predicted secreted protein